MLDININTSKWHLAEAKKLLRKWIIIVEKAEIKSNLKLAFLSKMFF